MIRRYFGRLSRSSRFYFKGTLEAILEKSIAHRSESFYFTTVYETLVADYVDLWRHFVRRSSKRHRNTLLRFNIRKILNRVCFSTFFPKLRELEFCRFACLAFLGIGNFQGVGEKARAPLSRWRGTIRGNDLFSRKSVTWPTAWLKATYCILAASS